MCARGFQRSGLDDGGASKVVVEDGLAIGFEDRLSGHCVGGEVGGGWSCERKAGCEIVLVEEDENRGRSERSIGLMLEGKVEATQ